MHCITKKCSTPNELTSVLVIKSYEEYCIVYVNTIVLWMYEIQNQQEVFVYSKIIITAENYNITAGL